MTDLISALFGFPTGILSVLLALVLVYWMLVFLGAADLHLFDIDLDGSDAALETGQVVLLDLWGGRSLQTVFADQTWMGYAGDSPPDDVVRVWQTVRDARNAAIARLRERWAAGDTVTGADLDRAARDVIAGAGYGEAFVHRTGHSIDHELHGSGPHLDSFETNDTRRLVAGIGFSIEPGVYLTGEFGVRSEVNVVLQEDGVRVTPNEPQENLITL